MVLIFLARRQRSPTNYVTRKMDVVAVRPRGAARPRQLETPRDQIAARSRISRAFRALLSARALVPATPRRRLGASRWAGRDGEAAQGGRREQLDDEERHGDGGAPVQAPAVGEVRARAEEVHGASRPERPERARRAPRTPRSPRDAPGPGTLDDLALATLSASRDGTLNERIARTSPLDAERITSRPSDRLRPSPPQPLLTARVPPARVCLLLRRTTS